METWQTTCAVEELITKSLEEFVCLKWEKDYDEKNRLIFPEYIRIKNFRISEQEARLLLIKQIEKSKSFWYSVETQTKKKYNGKTGRFDLCLYVEGNEGDLERKHLIEFKALVRCVKRDFEKLLFDEGNLTNYFIHVFGSLENTDQITEKYKEAIKDAKNKKVHIGKTPANLVIFVCEINSDTSLKEPARKPSLRKYKVSGNGLKLVCEKFWDVSH